MRFPTSVLVALFALVGLVGVAAAQGIGEDDPHPDHSHIPTGEPGLGEYGTEGPITRDLLPAGMETLVSDEALELAQSPELAEARRAWDLESDFVHQVSYQLRFRPTTDFMSVSPQDLGDLLLEKPNNIGIVDMGLFLSDAEAAELARRDALGDRMPALVEAVTGDGVKTDQTAQPGANDPSFGGVWQDQLDGGAIVLAVTDRTGVDESSLNEVVGGAENLRVIEVPYSFQQVNEFRDQLLFEAEALGIRASVPIHSTGTGRTIVVQVPDPDGLPADFGSKVPADVYTVVEGTGVVEAGAPGSHHGSDVMPGVAVSIWRQGEPQGGACTWGFNGHTNSQSYAIVAGHCGLNDWNNHSGWTTDMYVGHPVIPSLLVLNGWGNNTFVKNRYSYGNYDAMRIDIDDYADTNCYHVRETSSTNGHCTSPIKNRASYNSWEINSDRSCMSRGKTNSFECGWIREENFNSTNYVRVEIFSQGGDSGAGLLYAGTADGILVWHVDANNSAFMTTYYVQVELGNGYFYLNCAPTATTKTPSQWGSCPIVDR